MFENWGWKEWTASALGLGAVVGGGEYLRRHIKAEREAEKAAAEKVAAEAKKAGTKKAKAKKAKAKKATAKKPAAKEVHAVVKADIEADLASLKKAARPSRKKAAA